MEIDRLTSPFRVAGAAALLLIITLFLPWYGASIEGFGVAASFTAWQSFALIDVLLFLLAGAALLLVAMVAAGRERDLPLAAATIVTTLGGAATLLVFYRFLDLPFDGVDRRYGLFLGLASAIAIAIGGRIAMRDQNESFSDARAEIQGGVDQVRTQAAETIGGDSRSYDEMTREELYEEAQSRDIEGRSDMDKAELAEALRRNP